MPNSDERKKRIAEQIAQKTKQMLESLPDDTHFIRGTEDFDKKTLNKKFVEDDEFAADLVGNTAATLLEHAIRQSKKKKKKDDE